MIAVDPPQGGAAIYSEIDDTVPPPAAVTGEKGTAPATAAPLPSAHTSPKPAQQIEPIVEPEQSGPARLAGAIFHWPFPILAELVLVLVAVVLVVRRRQQRLDVDGPP